VALEVVTAINACDINQMPVSTPVPYSFNILFLASNKQLHNTPNNPTQPHQATPTSNHHEALHHLRLGRQLAQDITTARSAKARRARTCLRRVLGGLDQPPSRKKQTGRDPLHVHRLRFAARFRTNRKACSEGDCLQVST
jgi:hypothetical protein